MAMTNLYGLFSTKHLLDVYNSQNDEELVLSDLVDYLHEEVTELKRNHVFFEDGLFFHEAILLEEESLKEIYEDKQLSAYYVPEKEELLRYADPYYFEKNGVYSLLEDYLTENLLDGDRGRAEEIATEVHDYLVIDDNDDYLKALNIINHYVDFLEEQGRKLLTIIGNYAMTVRKWKYNGYSLQQSVEILREQANFGKTPHNKKLDNLLEQYIVALTNLYGRVTKEKVAEIYNLQNEDQVSIDEVAAYLENPPASFEANFVMVGWDEFVSDDLTMFDGIYEELVKAQAGKPFYVPEQEELLKYVDTNYVDYPKEYDELCAYLDKNIYPNDPNKTERIAENIQLILEMGDGINLAMQEITLDGYVFKSKKEMTDIADLLRRLNNHTRMRENNRLTPSELGDMVKKNQKKVIKIGRNDPCHCGSGKKYKKCCLQKDRKRK